MVVKEKDLITIELPEKGYLITTQDLFVTQWNKGQKLEILGLEDGTEVQFGNEVVDATLNRYVTNGIVDIPDIMLTYAEPIYAYVELFTADSETTEYKILIRVEEKTKPGDYIEPEDEESFREQMETIMNETKEIAQQALDKATDVENRANNGDFNGSDYVITEDDYDEIAGRVPTAEIDKNGTVSIASVGMVDGVDEENPTPEMENDPRIINIFTLKTWIKKWWNTLKANLTVGSLTAQKDVLVAGSATLNGGTTVNGPHHTVNAPMTVNQTINTQGLNMPNGARNTNIGTQNNVDGEFNFVKGSNNQIVGAGNNNHINGNNNIISVSRAGVFPSNNLILGNANGDNSSLKGAGNFIVGDNNEFDSSLALYFNTIFGTDNVLQGNARHNFIVGTNNKFNQSSDYITSFGINHRQISAFDYAFVAGRDNIINAEAQSIGGYFNKPDEEALFMIGNGTSEENRSNAFKVSKEGKITASDDYCIVKKVYSEPQTLEAVENSTTWFCDIEDYDTMVITGVDPPITNNVEQSVIITARNKDGHSQGQAVSLSSYTTYPYIYSIWPSCVYLAYTAKYKDEPIKVSFYLSKTENISLQETYNLLKETEGMIVDSELSEESANPVQNKVITKEINNLNTTIGNIDALLVTI